MSWYSGPQRILRLAWPVMISMMSYSLMSAADAIFVGRLGTVPLAAIGLAVTGTFLFIGLPMGLVRGLRVATAQATGAERSSTVEVLGWQAVWLALGTGLAVVIASPLGSPMFHLLDATSAVR